MDIMNVTCAETETEDGFEFRVSPDRFTQFSEFECEQLWYSKDDRLMADPSNPHRLIDPVISVSSDRLVTSYCVDELRHEIYCYTSGLRMETVFKVRNETAATPNSDVLDEVTPSLQLSDQLWWLFALFIIIFIIFICFMLRKRIFRCFQREVRFIRQREDDPENRDLVKVGSDDPHSLQESETVRCPDDDHKLML